MGKPKNTQLDIPIIVPEDASALLEIVGTNGGILIPRLTTIQRDSISSPAKGLFIYNIDVDMFQYYNSIEWLSVSTDVQNIQTISANFTISESGDYMVNTNSNPIVVTLNCTEKQKFTITNIGNINNITIIGNINNYDDDYILPGESFQIVYDSINYNII